MKTRLMHRYYELREVISWRKISDNVGIDTSLLSARMMRIEHILLTRYSYDISLMHQLN
jgi:hypothetical protein